MTTRAQTLQWQYVAMEMPTYFSWYFATHEHSYSVSELASAAAELANDAGVLTKLQLFQVPMP